MTRIRSFIFVVAVLVLIHGAGVANAAELTVQEQTGVVRDIQDRILAQQQAVAKAEADLRNATNTAARNSAQSALDIAKSLLESLMKLLEQATSPLTQANLQCNPVKIECGCGKVETSTGCKPGNNKYLCTCKQPIPGTEHLVTGICVAPLKCEGQQGTNLEGQMTGVGDIGGIVGQIFKGLFDKLTQGGSAGGGGGPVPGSSGCAQYYQVTIPSSDPCAIYTPPTSGSILTSPGAQNASNQLLDALSGGSQSTIGSAFGSGSGASNVSDQLLGTLQNIGGSGSIQSTQSGGSVQTSGLTQLSPGLAQGVTLPPGTRGDIQVIGTGATIFAGSRDVTGNVEVAGFYGADTLGSAQPQGLAARMCENRPWAASLVSYVIPPSFFDGLCTWRGYQVGPPPAPPAPIIQPYKPPATVAATTTQTVVPTIPVPTVPPEVDIWAAPQKVPLGARTSIFWNSKGVTSCQVSASDGNFSETALAGGAATVPITTATVFTITCQTPSGSSVSESVTVSLAI